MAAYEADLGLRVKLTREPTDAEAEAVAASIERALKAVTVLHRVSSATKIILIDAEVTDWKGVS